MRTTLVEGARVMLLVNLDLEAEGQLKLCNGSLGTFLRLARAEEARAALEAKVDDLNKKVLALGLEAGTGDSLPPPPLLSRSLVVREALLCEDQGVDRAGRGEGALGEEPLRSDGTHRAAQPRAKQPSSVGGEHSTRW